MNSGGLFGKLGNKLGFGGGMRTPVGPGAMAADLPVFNGGPSMAGAHAPVHMPSRGEQLMTNLGGLWGQMGKQPGQGQEDPMQNPGAPQMQMGNILGQGSPHQPPPTTQQQVLQMYLNRRRQQGGM